MPIRKPAEELFWSKVDRPGSCWLWTAAVDKDGYGKFQVTLPRGDTPPGEKTPQRYLRAHHFAWELSHERVPAGALLMHSCDTPARVNPAHLSIGTPKKNYEDSAAKDRNTRGERNANAKVTAADVREIRSSRRPVRELAERHNIGKGTVYAIRRGRIWRHVLDGTRQLPLFEVA